MESSGKDVLSIGLVVNYILGPNPQEFNRDLEGLFTLAYDMAG